jgi:putative ABC transport system permease protein
MRILSRLSSLWNTVARADALDRELDAEIRATLETLVARHVSSGMHEAAARRAALAALGGPSGIVEVRENVRERRIGATFESLLLDLRYACRGLRKARGLTFVIVCTLALGIGANTAIFSVVRAMLLAPLPYPDADRLAFIWLDRSDVGYPRGPLSGEDLRDLRAGTKTFTAIGGIWASGTIALAVDGRPEQWRRALVTENFFSLLGAEAAIGRTFRPQDSAPHASPTILIGWNLFMRRFGGDPSIVGRQVLVDDQPTTVVGVMPPSFRLLLPPDASVPDDLQIWQPFWPELLENPRGHLFLRVVARMNPGVTIAQSGDDVDAVAQRITRDLGVRRAFTTVALHLDDTREIRGPLLALFAGVGILLTIACVNVASLLIARTVSRAKETALRLALGASRLRLVRQLLIEGCLLTTLGAAAGVLVGYLGLDALLALAPDSLARMSSSRVDATVLAFTVLTSVLWGLLFSLAPAIELRRIGRDRLQPRRLRYRTRATLVVAQITMSVVLLVGAGLLARGFVEVQRIDPGFHTDRRLTFRVALPEHRYTDANALVSATRALQRRLSEIRGVTNVGAISHLPFDDLPNWYLTYALEATSSDNWVAKADTRSVTPSLFETLGVTLAEGRFFAEEDGHRTPVAIIDEMLARQLWPGRSAIGQHVVIGQASPEFSVSVVGVVKHLRLRSLVEDLTPQIFLPYQLWQRSPMAFVIDVADGFDPATLVSDVRTAVSQVDPRLPVFEVRPLERYVEGARSARRFTMLLAVAFAASALLLTCIGVYGVLAYAVATRRRELGVRRALGADTVAVIGEVLREGVGLALVGCGAGLAMAALTARWLQMQLYAIHSRDPITYVIAIAVMLAGAALACWIPAHRATAISPMDALRTE